MKIKKNRSKFKRMRDLNISEVNSSLKAMRHILRKNNQLRMEMKKTSLKKPNLNKDKNKVKRKKMVILKDNTNRI